MAPSGSCPRLAGMEAVGYAPLLVAFTLHSLLLKCSPSGDTDKSLLKARCLSSCGM